MRRADSSAANNSNMMKRGAYFVNTARGPMVDYDALTEALKTRHLRGAALETFALEPAPADLELLQLDNVTLTPHIAGASVKTVKTPPQPPPRKCVDTSRGRTPQPLLSRSHPE